MLTPMARCWLCQQSLYDSHHGICSHCLRHLPQPPVCCPRCGLPAANRVLPCGRCLQHPPAWHSLLLVGDYQPPFNQLIWHFKLQGKTELAPALARLLLMCWLERRRQMALTRPDDLPRPDILLTVPLHRWRHWRRGFNQSDLLARHLAHWVGCAYHPDGLARTRNTAQQRTLPAAARRRNLKGAFKCRMALDGKRVALLDDVVTTGSTVEEISRILLAAGAAQVQIWCLCRTL
ncbi:DNA utilization protein GntX [Musicola keenii]|uniref:DNA utilization protein GntX n=1 Tax=Musicola keenii TaxID=2884250 RepID=UPI0017814206|nr:DNA utilization protein GntX [Musicola keenii]